jgi:hypothetical protein
MHAARRALLAAVLGLLLAPAPAAAQFGLFGPNKVQYRRFEWRILRGPHVDLYHYPEADELARVALTSAEDAYRDLERRFRHAVDRRIPLVVYASHADFEQTTLLPFVPPEGLLGFTEFGRGRVALPFRGSYREFLHTLRHELVHVFHLSRTRLNALMYPRLTPVPWPLWFTEGLAEYWSEGEDSQDDMVLRDLTLGGRLPTIARLGQAGGSVVYPLGGSLVRFLAQRYGEWRLVQLYDDQWKYDSFDALLSAVFGRSLETLTAEWHYAMKRRYYPLVEEQRPLALDARRLASAAVKPTVWVPADGGAAQVLFVSPRSGYTDVYSVPLEGGKARTVVKGERSAELESFHTFESRLDVSPAGILVFATKYLERDALIFWDLRTGRRVGRYQFPDLVATFSPAWAPDGRSVVFSGLSVGGFSDLYRLHLPDGRLERLTSDRYRDADPSFSPDGTRIVFASDRTVYGADGAENLFLLDLRDGTIRYLTCGPWRDAGPRWSPSDGAIAFTSDRRGVPDIYVVDTLGTGRRETGVPGGTFDPVWVPSEGRFVFGGFEDLQLNLYVMRRSAPDSTRGDSAAAGEPVALALPDSAGRRWTPAWRWRELDDPRFARTEPEPYERRFQLDVAAVDALVIPGYASAQGATFLLSDMLAEHLLLFSVATYQQGNSVADLAANFNGAVTYLNQTERLNWGLGAFRFRGRFYENGLDQVYEQTTTGGLLLLRFPLSRFTRVEGRFQAEHSDRLDYMLPAEGIALPRRRGVLVSNYLSWVHDNALWLPTGPIDGTRLNATLGLVSDLSNARFDSWLAAFDARRYLRTSLTSAVALRGLVYLSGGERPTRVAIGGTWGLRGYPRFSYITGSRALMLNAEWRFPVTDYLSLGFPFGEWRIPGVQGAVFADAGRAWTPRSAYRAVIGSYGIGLRMSVAFPLVLRFDAGWRYGRGSAYGVPLDYRRKRFADLWFGFNY